MTPKEKAKDLLNKYFLILVDECWADYFTIAKKCALKSVDELLLVVDEQLSCSISYIDSLDYIDYWNKVKKEIENEHLRNKIKQLQYELLDSTKQNNEQTIIQRAKARKSNNK